MEAILDVLKFTLPGLIVFATAYFLLKTLMDNEQKKRTMESKLNNQKLITPLRLQAYERLILFLERITPDQIILRTFETWQTSEDLQSALIQTIRAEYEHNISQQVYVSGKTWGAIKITKENMVKIVNTCAARLPKDAPAVDLTRLILEMVMSLEREPTATAIELLKIEASQYF